MKKSLNTRILLIAMAISFILTFGLLFFPDDSHLKRASFIVAAVLGLIFMVLGIILIFTSRYEKGKLKSFLLLTGFSAITPLLGTLLHNFFYGMAITFTNLAPVFEFLHGTFFIIAVLVAPITFIIGVIGSLVLMRGK